MNETLKDLDYVNYIQKKIHNINRQNLNFGETSNDIIKIIIISNNLNSINSQNLKFNI